jgi:hypothetical protein
MRENDGWEGFERRNAERIEDRSILLVNGRDAAGSSFDETTSIHDVSPEGVAFFLKTRVQEGDFLHLRICLEEGADGPPTPSFFVSVKILRVTRPQDERDMFLVAGKFVEDAIPLSEFHDIEAMARKLQMAIAKDEESRNSRY